jgi:hypothetical protein
VLEKVKRKGRHVGIQITYLVGSSFSGKRKSLLYGKAFECRVGFDVLIVLRGLPVFAPL